MLFQIKQAHLHLRYQLSFLPGLLAVLPRYQHAVFLQLWKDPPLKRHTQVSSAALGLSVGYFILDIGLIVRHFPWVCLNVKLVVMGLPEWHSALADCCLEADVFTRRNMVDRLQMGGPEMLTHHVAAFLSVALASFTGQAHLYTLLLLSTELTTPFVNARWMYDLMVCRPLSRPLCGSFAYML